MGFASFHQWYIAELQELFSAVTQLQQCWPGLAGSADHAELAERRELSAPMARVAHGPGGLTGQPDWSTLAG